MAKNAPRSADLAAAYPELKSLDRLQRVEFLARQLLRELDTLNARRQSR
ncbi:MAG: hypothetical protein AABY18_01250 [Candidatus Thermoplasmatota archaeon]